MRMRRLFCLIFWLAIPSLAWGQYGSIAGTVSDPSGAALPGATITATNAATNAVRIAKSGMDGGYEIPQLSPGIYVLTAEASGFKKISRPDIKLDVAGRIALDWSMELGSTTETVSVTAEAPLLRTADAQIGEVIDKTMIENLPLLNRNALELVRLAGNVSGGGVSTNGDPSSTGPGVLAIAGGRTGSIDYTVDGQNINSGRGHEVLSTATPTMESVAEFKVITGGMSAEYGRSSGGIVEVATVGGTNQLHGQLFEFFRNQTLNANSWLQNATGGEKQAYKQNIYGGSLGGPVILPRLYNGRNKTFWYFNFQGTKYRQAAVNVLGGVPTAAEREGDLTGTLYNGTAPLLYDPLGATAVGTDGNLYRTELLGGDGLHVPADRIHPMTKAVLDGIPLPNRTPTPGFSELNNYVGQQATGTNDTTWSFRVDENLTERHRLFLRYRHDNYENYQSSWMGILSPPIVPSKIKGGMNAELGYDFAISPTLILSARVGGNHSPVLSGPDWPSSFNRDNYPFDPSVKAWSSADRLPFSIILNSNGGWGGSRLVNTAWPHSDLLAYNTFNPSVSLTKVFRKHILKVGTETRRYYDNFLETGLGWMAFDGFATLPNAWGGTWVQSNSNMVAANSLGDFLLGYLNSTQQSAPWTMALNMNYWAGFAQDDWKVNSKLTLNFGVRWDTELPVTERHEKLVAWDPNAPSAFTIPSDWNWNAALGSAGLSADQIAMFPEPAWSKGHKYPNGAMAVAGTPEYPGRTLQYTHYKHFAPRFGVAYRLNDKTTLRSALTMMYISQTGDYYSMWTTVVPSTSGVGPWDGMDASGIPLLSWDHMFPPTGMTYYQHTIQEANYQVGGNLGGPVFSVAADMPREYQWNFTVQRQLTPNMVAEAAYVGNHSGTLLIPDSTNPFPMKYLDPTLGTLLETQIANPVAGQIMPDDNSYTGATVPLGALLNSNPSRGNLTVQGLNVGTSNYHSLNLRVERRMSKGVAFLFNYTYSKLLDNAGGPNMNFWGSGTYEKTWQSTDSYRNIYGYDMNDRTHRLAFYHDVQLPFGKGRKFMGSPQTLGGKILDGVVGGWEVAGFGLLTSGTPLTFSSTGGVSSQGQGVPNLWGTVQGAPGNSSLSSPGGLLRSPSDNHTECQGAFNCSQFGLPQLLTYGNMGFVYGGIRNPGYASYDLSLMKKFNLTERVYFQIRVEAENALNLRGLGPYNTTLGDAYFGYITSAGNTPRIAQISGRLVF